MSKSQIWADLKTIAKQIGLNLALAGMSWRTPKAELAEYLAQQRLVVGEEKKEEKKREGKEEKKQTISRTQMWADLKRMAFANNVSVKSNPNSPLNKMGAEWNSMRKKYGIEQKSSLVAIDPNTGLVEEKFYYDEGVKKIDKRTGGIWSKRNAVLRDITGRRPMFFVELNSFMAIPYLASKDKIEFNGDVDDDGKIREIKLTNLTFKIYEDPRKSKSAMEKIYDHVGKLYTKKYKKYLIAGWLEGQLVQARGFPNDDMKRLYDKQKGDLWRKNIKIKNVIPITTALGRDRLFGDVILKADKPLEFSSLGTNSSDTWNSSVDECAINAILSELRGTENFKTLSRQSIYQEMGSTETDNLTVNILKNWLTKRKIPCYLLDSTNCVVWKSDFKMNETHHKTIFLKIDNDHIYPIQDEKLQTEIVRTGSISPCSIDYSSGFNVVDLSSQTLDDCKAGVNIIQNYKPNHNRGSHNNLTGLCLDFIKNHNIVPENVACDGQNQVIQFSIGEKWFVHKKDYDMVRDALDATLRIPEMKKRAKDFQYRGQPIQSITKDLLRATNMNVPTSEFCSQTMEIYDNYKSGAYNGDVYHESKNICEEAIRTVDIRRCYTSIAYNRYHAWGIFRPWCEWVDIPENFKMVEGAMFIIENVDIGNGLKLGDGVHDSQFTEYALSHNLIKLSQIKKMLNPFFTIPHDQFKKTIDLIYENYSDKIAKMMVNLYIGTLGSRGGNHIITDSSFTTSEALAMEWMARGEEYMMERVDDVFMRYKKVKSATKTLSNNVMMFQSVVSNGYLLLHKLAKRVLKTGLVSKVWKYHTDSMTVEMKDPSMDFKMETADGSKKYLDEKSNRWGLGSIRKERPELIEPLLFNPHTFKEDKQLTKVRFTKFIKSDNVNIKLGCIVVGRAGRGKSWTLMNKIIPQLNDYLIVSLTHKALENLTQIPKNKKRTLASLFMDKGESQRTMLSNIANSISTIILEEYTMASQKDLIKLYKLHQLGVSIILIGDHHQIPAIDNRAIKSINYSFIREMCPILVELTHNYRFDKELDNLSMRVYNEGIFEPTPEMILNTEEKTRLNICYYRKTKFNINKQFSDSNKLLNTPRVKTKDGHVAISGSPVICTEKLEGQLVNGTMCDIVNIIDGSVIIKSDREYTISTKKFTKNFVLGHAGTVHCFQGSTIKGDLTIHDTGSMTRELLYTALTRATALSHIKVKTIEPVRDIKHTRYYNKYDPSVLLTKNVKNMKTGYIFMNKETNAFGYTTIKPKNNIISTVQYYDEMELRTEAQFALNRLINDGVEVGDVQQYLYKKKSLKRLVARQYRKAKTTKLLGCISTKNNTIILRWSVNGKRKQKEWQISKKRSSEQALELAKEHQLKLSE